ncbi:MAG: holin family protein [Amylibacter sp.]
MGLIRDVLGIGKAVKDVAKVFVVNKTENAKFEHLEHSAALDQFSEEFRRSRGNWFNNLIDGLIRLPRPILTLGTVGLFVFSMVDPTGFSKRMIALDTVPCELWWLLAAIVSFYFGAREMHYVRNQRPGRRKRNTAQNTARVDAEENAALADWVQTQPD